MKKVRFTISDFMNEIIKSDSEYFKLQIGKIGNIIFNYYIDKNLNKVELDKIIANINREIKKELIGLKFLKSSLGKSYVPVSIERRKALEITTEERKRIVFILYLKKFS